jgi:ribosome production factor 1
MGKKIRHKKKKEKPRKKLPQTRKKKRKTKPETITNKVIKSGSENELEKELEKLNQANKYNPTKNTKNKEKRRELVMMRSSLKKRLKAKLRRKHQKRKEELNSDEDNDNIYIPKQTPKTIDMMREIDENMINENDEEIKESLNEDEYKNYFNGEYEPQILLTTSIKHTGGIYKFIRALKNLIPNSYFYYRKKYDLGTIMKKSIEKGFSDIIVITERLRKPYKILLIHLPNGPTLEFKLFNVIYQNEIEGHGTSSGHNPELMFKNFKTNLGYRIKRCLNAIFPKNEELKGRELITFHNQRDYIFFRYYRYIFEEENEDNNNNSNIKVKLQEIGPRFVMRLLYVQKGLFDPQFGEYEWLYNHKMGVKRRKFYL